MRKILLFFLFLSASFYAQDKPLKTRISIFKQNFTGNEPIILNVSIINEDNKEQTVFLSDSFGQSIFFELRSSANEPIDLKPEVNVTVRTVYSNPQLYRKMTLLSRESYSRSYDLRNFFDMSTNGSYYVRARFFPDPDNRTLYYESEFARFTHSPPDAVQRTLEQKNIQKQADIQKAKDFLPNEVMADFFEAQMTENWDRFLMHIDLERLIYAFDNYAGQYNATQDGNFRLDIIEQFKRFLTLHWKLFLTGYEIKETVIFKDTAVVTVDVQETVRISQRRIRYRFELHRTASGQWLIYNYTVLALN